MTQTIKTTDANICINDLRTDKDDHTEHKVITVKKEELVPGVLKLEETVEAKEDMKIIAEWVKMPQDTPRLDELLRKPFYNEFERIERIERMVKEMSNDQELGVAIRREFS